MWRAGRCPPYGVAGRVWLGLGLGVGLGLAPFGPATAQLTPQVVNGAPELAEPTTAALVQGDAASGFVVCSAVLIGCDSAITAAHCFNSYAGERTTLFFQHAGFVPIESATRHPAYEGALAISPPDWAVLRVEDIAFLKLAAPVSGIVPSRLIGGPAPEPGTPGRVVGFGRNPVTEVTSFLPNAGIKRSGSMELSACSGNLAGSDVLCWEPDPVLGDPGDDVSTCNVDSGGPLFVDENGTRVVAGLTKGVVYDPQGQGDLCLPPAHPFDTNVARHRAWIESMALSTGAVSLGIPQCGGLPALPDDVAPEPCDGRPWSPGEGARTCGFTGELGGGGLPTQAQHAFEVPPETTLLRVALNGIASQNGSVITDFYLRAGAPASAALHDCGAAAAGNLGSCALAAPAPGAWFVQVDQIAGDGEYQVTVSLFGAGSPAVPGLRTSARVGLAAILAAVAATWRLRGRRRDRAPGSRRR